MDCYKGQTVYIRTGNHARVGTVVEVTLRELYLHPCADVIETGSFRTFFGGKTKSFGVIPTTAEVPSGVARASISTIDPWPHEVPVNGGD